MGFDPMTHRPRTDIFASLPHLIALANLKELMDQHSWEEMQAARLQTEATQMAKLQYLQLLLQPNINSPSFSNNSISHDIETYNLLASLSSLNKDNINNPLPNNISTPIQSSDTQDMINEMQMPFSHMPDLQIPCSFPPSLNKEMLQVTNFSSSSVSTTPPLSAPLVTESSISNAGDACSTSSYGGPTTSYWSELFLEDPLFNSIAWFLFNICLYLYVYSPDIYVYLSLRVKITELLALGTFSFICKSIRIRTSTLFSITVKHLDHNM